MCPSSPVDEEAIHVLLVEDDERLARLTAKFLEGHGVTVSLAHDGEAGLTEALRHAFDVVLLDIMLPRLGGLEVCRELRAKRDVPVIMVTARGDETDRVLGLELGADDYIAKPFSPRELLARIRAQVRRFRGKVGPPSRTLHAGRISIDPGAMRATLDGKVLALTGYEFALLKALAERAGRVLSREQLLDLAHGSAEEAFDRSIDVHISRLRQKLEDDPRQPRIIKTVRGAGYLLATGDDE